MQDQRLESIAILQNVVARYLAYFPLEAVADQDRSPSHSLRQFLTTTSFEEVYNRKNFEGHITASAFILNATATQVLLLHHKSLNRWLQPGGHVDSTDLSILDAAYREVEEETGLKQAELMLIPIGESIDIPFDIDSHAIPENPRKEEDAHVHHDVRYLFRLRAEIQVAISLDESSAYRWVKLEELMEIPDHARVAKKISDLKIER